MQGSKRDTDRENGLVNTVEEGEGDMDALPCVKQIARGKRLYSPGSSAPGDLEGWVGEGMGDSRGRHYMYTYS